jgi:hypothetical protein
MAVHIDILTRPKFHQFFMAPSSSGMTMKTAGDTSSSAAYYAAKNGQIHTFTPGSEAMKNHVDSDHSLPGF